MKPDTTYAKTVKETTIGMLTVWKLIPKAIKETGEFFVDTLRCLGGLCICLLLIFFMIVSPFLVPLSPLLAFFVYRHNKKVDRMREEAMNRFFSQAREQK